MANIKKGRWRYNKSAVSGHFKKLEGFEDWFYTGPSLAFGHFPGKHQGKK